MRKLFFLVGILLSMISSAQLNTPQKGVSVDFGGGYALHRLYSNVNIGGGYSFSSVMRLEVRYKEERMFYGIKFEHHNYQTDETDTTVRFINAESPVLQFSTGFHLVEKKKFALYLNPGIGVGNMSYHRKENNGNDGKVFLAGFTASMGIGMNYHFKGHFGLFFHTGFSYLTMNMKSFKINGEEKEKFESRDLADVNYTFRGVDAKLGIRYVFGKLHNREVVEFGN